MRLFLLVAAAMALLDRSASASSAAPAWPFQYDWTKFPAAWFD
jgi:hypothetical protein